VTMRDCEKTKRKEISNAARECPRVSMTHLVLVPVRFEREEDKVRLPNNTFRSPRLLLLHSISVSTTLLSQQ